jgi:hypothetical protein
METKSLDYLTDKYRNTKVDKDFIVEYKTDYFYIKDKEPYQATILVRANKTNPYIDMNDTTFYKPMAKMVVNGEETALNLFSTSSANTTNLDKFTTSGYTFVSAKALLEVRNKSKELADNYRRLARLQDTKVDYYNALIDKFPEVLL